MVLINLLKWLATRNWRETSSAGVRKSIKGPRPRPPGHTSSFTVDGGGEERRIRKFLRQPADKMASKDGKESPSSSSSGEHEGKQLYRAGIAAQDGVALKYVQDYAEPGPMRDLVDFFVTARENMAIFPVYRQSLSAWQRDHFFTASKSGQWENVQFAREFAAEVERYRLISFDTESRKDPDTGLERVILAHFGTATGMGVLFDLETMSSGCWAPPDDALRDVPKCFKCWLRAPGIYTVGSAIAGDEKKVGLQIKRMVDMREVFYHYRNMTYEGKPIVDIGHTTKTGLGVQAFYSKGVDYKPMARHKHVALYGDPGYKTFKGSRTWPEFKHWNIYKWKRDETGALAVPGKFYCYHDLTTPQATIASIFLDMAAGPGVVVGGSCSVADAIHTVLGPIYNKQAEVRFDLVEDDVDMEEKPKVEEKPGPSIAASVAVAQVLKDQGAQAQEEKEVVALTSSASTEGSDTLSLDHGEELSEGEIRDEEPPQKKVKKVKQAVIRPVPLPAYDCRWDWEVDRRNPYVRHPLWGKHCQVCGIGKHAAKNKEGDTTCPLLKETGWIGCGYRRCRTTGHRTIVCPALHQICPLCYHRGHDRYAGCATWSPLQWRVALGDFEECAPEGLYTTSRQHDERWGFWAAKSGTPYPYPVAYKDLLELGVAEADRALQAQRPGVVVSAAGPPPPPPPGAPGGSHGRPVTARLGPSPSAPSTSRGFVPRESRFGQQASAGRAARDPSAGNRREEPPRPAPRASTARSRSASAGTGPASATRSRRRHSPEVKYLGKGKREHSRGRK